MKSKIKQTIEHSHWNTFDAAPSAIRISTDDVRPSWKSTGSGSNTVKITASGLQQGNLYAGWLMLDVTETAVGDKRDTTKEVSVTVDVPGMIALRDILNNLDLGCEPSASQH